MRGIVFHPRLDRVLLGFAYHRCTGRLPLFSAGPVKLQELPQQGLPGACWVRVRSQLAGICGSDLKLLRLEFSIRSASLASQRSLNRPFCLGHEAVGQVVEVGPGVRTLVPGQRVALVPGASCAGVETDRPCAMCQQGLPLLCLNRDQIVPELAWGAAWSEQFVRHERQLVALPDAVSDEQAVLLEPLACSVHAVLRRLPTPGDTVVVVGCGTIGLGIILALRTLRIPLRIIAIAKHRCQAEQARTLGADLVLAYRLCDLYEHLASALGTEVRSRGANNRLLHQGAAVIYDTVGSSETLHHALRWTRPRGAVVVEGVTPRPAPFDCTVIWLREVDLIGSHGHGLEYYNGQPIHTFHLVLEWLRQRKLVSEQLITHRFSLGDYRPALRAAARKSASNATKVLLDLRTYAPTLH